MSYAEAYTLLYIASSHTAAFLLFFVPRFSSRKGYFFRPSLPMSICEEFFFLSHPLFNDVGNWKVFFKGLFFNPFSPSTPTQYNLDVRGEFFCYDNNIPKLKIVNKTISHR